MGRIFLICFLFISGLCYGQYPLNQTIGSDSTLVTSKGGFKGRIVNWSYTDTTQANTQRIKQYPGAQIFTTNDSLFWLRNPTATKWVQVFTNTGGAGGDTLVWKLSGNTVGSRQATPGIGTLDAYDLNVITNGQIRFSVPSGGIVYNISPTTVALRYDTVTKQMYHGDAGGGTTYTFSNGLNESGGAVKLGGTLTEETSISGFPGYENLLFEDLGSFLLQTRNNGFIYLEADKGDDQVNISRIRFNADTTYLEPGYGNLTIDSLNNVSSQDKLVGWTSTTGANRGRVGNVTIGSGLSLSGGTLSATATTPTLQQVLTAGSTLTTNNTINAGSTLFKIRLDEDQDFTGFEGLNYGGIIGFQNGIGVSQFQSGSNISGLDFSGGNARLSVSTASKNSELNVTLDSIEINPPLGKLIIDTLTSNAGTKALRYNPTTGLVSYADTTSGGGGGSGAVSEGITKRNDTTIINNNRNIYYINQATTGAALPADYSAIGSPTYSVTNGVWQFGGNAQNYTQYIRSNNGVLSEGSYIECYVIVDSLRTSSVGPQIGWQSYNPYSGGIYQHSVFGGVVTGSAATNSGKAFIYGSSGSSTTVSDSARSTSVGDTLYMRLDRMGIDYLIRIENLTQDWKLQRYTTTTPQGVPFVAHNSAYPVFVPGGGGYKVYGFKYVIAAPLQTENHFEGNSITYGQGATTQYQRWMSLVGTPSLNIGGGGGADGTAEVLARVKEIIAIKPNRVVLMIGGNDLLFGVSSATWQANYTAIRDSLVNRGIEVVHCFPTPRTTTNELPLKLFIDTSTRFRSDRKIDTWTSLLGSGTDLAAKYSFDGTHPNDAGHAQVAALVNTALHYSNTSTFTVAGNGYAPNGYLMGTDNGTGMNQFGAGGIISRALNSSTKETQMGYDLTNNVGYIQAYTRGSSYDNLVLNSSSASATSSFVGIKENNPTATLDIRSGFGGSGTAVNINHGGAYSANGQQLRVSFQNGHVDKVYIGTELHDNEKFAFFISPFDGTSIFTTPVLWVSGFGRVGINTKTPTDALEVVGNLSLNTAGNKIKIATGSNASIGTATLVAGTVTVSTTAVTTSSKIFVSVDTPGGTQGFISVPTASIVNATSFVINSSSVLETSTVNYLIIN